MALETVSEETTVQPDDVAADDTIPAAESQDSLAVENSGDGTNPGAEPEFSEDATSLAASYGLDPSDYRNEQSLYKAVALIDRQLSQWSRSFAQQPQEAKATQQQPAQASPQVEKQRPDFEKLFPSENWDQSVRDAFKALDDYHSSRFDGLHKQVGELTPVQQKVAQFEQFLQVQEQQSYERSMDEQFSKLGPEWKATFGDKAMRELPHGPMRDARNAVANEITALYQADIHLNRQPGTPESYFRRALGSVFGHNQQAIARNQITAQLASNKNRALPGANGKQTKPLAGEDRAWAVAKAKFEAAGIAVSDD